MPGYLVKEESIAVAGVDDLVIRSLLDRQQFSDPLGVADALGISSAAWPIFGQLWPSGALLAARLAARPVVAGQRILEIGCGLALASLVGHRRGNDMTASDCHPLAARFLAANLLLNHLPPMKYRHGPWRESTVDSGRNEVDATTPALGRFDLIIGSDVLYERDADAILAGFITRHAERGAEVWIVDPNRGNRPAFNRQMATRGFSMREERLDHAATSTLAGYKGRLLTYRRAEA